MLGWKTVPYGSYANDSVPVGAQVHVDKARRDLELLETKRHAAELRMRESQAKEAAEAARRAAAEQVEQDRQQARFSVKRRCAQASLLYASHGEQNNVNPSAPGHGMCCPRSF